MEPDDLSVLIGPLPQDDRPLATRLYEALRQAIRAERLKGGTRLPSTRQAALQLGMARNTVITAYELLAAEAMVTLAPRRAPVVASGVTLAMSQEAAPRLSVSERAHPLTAPYEVAAGPLSPGRPDPTLFPADLWARALRRVARRDLGTSALYDHYQGLPALREALADHWLRHLGMAVDPDQILIMPTTQSCLSLIGQLLADPGDVALLEDPGYRGARFALEGAGLRVMPLPVGPEGAVFNEAGPARLAYVTPAAQYPTGVRMGLMARQAALAWAERTGGVLVSDEYDGEFLWHGAKLPSLASMSEGAAVITLGSAAKALLPGLRLGWMVLPKGIVADFVHAQRNLGIVANIHAQAALASLLNDGALRVHLRHAAKVYAARRDLVIDALRDHLGTNRVPPQPDGGLQILLPLEDGVQEARLAAAAQAAGFGTRQLSCNTIAAAAYGLLIGFADATPRHAKQFAAVIADALDGSRPRPARDLRITKGEIHREGT